MPSYKLLALDVDGTLIGRDGLVRPATAAAVARASAAGIRPVLCTGRRYRRARPVARQLGLDAPLVCNSGALVKDPGTHRTLWRADLGGELMVAVLDVLRSRGEPAVSIVDHEETPPDFLIPARPTGRHLFDDYVERNGQYALVDPDWMDRPERGSHFHLFAVGERDAMLEIEALLLLAAPGRLRTFVLHTSAYRGVMCEVLDTEASKWSAVLHLAERWGIGPDQIVAVGDDVNDLPMIRGAGLGVAMGQAPEVVREAADLVAPGFEDDGVAALIDGVLLA
ncbi:HAD family hydrolase [Tautonia plasticadhaerens]|uniref:Sugar phosphatase YidA n=1 Tax=Tautonia plasticadhaerens TaxID=2527974 RepID=A0A518GXD1_9BACT|nr:HAD family hydrolase [Tautonia plasticadhaerens]QDV33256.1 Sugar phosphatase YidA [Tautonia plasticadhaerens]